MNLIVIVDQNWGIGLEGQQLLFLKPDLKRFRELTCAAGAIIAGRKTLETFPEGQGLPNRRNFILSRTEGFSAPDCEVYHTVESLLEYAPAEAFVVGGESVYRQLLPYCEKAYVTKVEESFPADTFFPNLDQMAQWSRVEEEGLFEYEGLHYRYITYQRG